MNYDDDKPLGANDEPLNQGTKQIEESKDND